MTIETKLDEKNKEKVSKKKQNIEQYIKGCLNPENARLYGTFQERAALNITQFPKIQGSLLIRMGLIYPLISYLVDEIGLPPDAKTNLLGIEINYHTWIAGYLSYLIEIQTGMSKYPLELISRGITNIKSYYKENFSNSPK